MLVRFRRLVVPVAVVVVAGGCWGQYRGDASHSGNQPTEFGIGTGNVSTLAESWVGTTGGVVDTAPTVINNVAYVGAGDGKLYAFDATGAGCSGSPKTCEPLWTATVQASGSIRTSPAVTGGVVLVQGRNSMEAFDANGVTNCSGSPKTCTPLWSTVALGDVRSSPAVAGATVFTTGTDGLKAFDAAAGSGTCGGTPKVCSPLWASSETFAPGWDASPAVAGSSVYVSGATAMYVYDAAGIIGCSGTPKKCTSSWKASGASAAPAVVNGTVYLAGGDHGLSAYDANGVKRCAGSPKICAPLWSATLSAAAGERVDPPAVANDVVYLPFRGSIYAFDTTGYVPGDALVTGTGTDRCLARTVNLCTPRWQTAPRSPASDLVTGAPLNAGGVLYAGGHDRLTAYDDSGNANCAAFPKVCDPLWSTPTAAAGYAPPVVVGGVVYSGSGNGLHAFQPSAVAPAPTIAAIAPNPGVGQTAVPVTVTGTGFTAGLTVSTTIPGASLGSPASVTPTSFTVSVTVPATTAPGSYKLAVKNPDQGLATTTIIASGGATGPDVAGRAGIAAYPGIVGGPAADRDHDLANVRDAGATWTAIDFDWKATQPTNSTTAPNWSALDPVVKSAHQRGLHVLGIITYSPKWASPNCADENGVYVGHCFPDATHVAAFAAFAAAAAARYGSQSTLTDPDLANSITDWQIWNEPNHTAFSHPPDPDRYAAMLKAVYPAVKAADLGATVITGGTAPSPNESDGSEFAPTTWLEGIYDRGAQNSFDGVAHHPYSFPWNPLDDADYSGFTQARYLYLIMAAHGDANKKVWGTEMGAPTGTVKLADPTQPCFSRSMTDAEQAQWVHDYYLGWNTDFRSFTGPLIWKAVRDGSNNTNELFDNLGLFHLDFTAKPAFAAFQQITSQGVGLPRQGAHCWTP